MSIGGIVVGFVRGWELALVLTGAVIPMSLAVIFYSTMMATFT